MRRVFVSYSRHNQEAVAQLIDDLQAVGIDAWYDQTLTGGQRWWESILVKLRECDTFVFALSPEAWDSEACKSELDYVVQLGKPILPVLIADGININLLSPPLSEVQITDYRGRDKDAAFALVKSINMAPSAPALPDPLPTPPRVPVSYLGNLKERIECSKPLSPEEQITLLFELEAKLRESRSSTEIRDLMVRLKRRDDLLAKVAAKIDAALRDMTHEKSLGLDPDPPHPNLNGRTASHGPMVEPGAVHRPGPPSRAGRSASPATAVAHGPAGGAGVLVSPRNAAGIEGSTSRRYLCPPHDAPELIDDVKSWLDAKGFDSQQMGMDDESLLLQVRKRGRWRDFVGMATSLNVLFRQSGDTLTVEIGAGKWIDKAAVGAVSVLIFFPLAVTAGFGAWEQMKLPDKIFDYIGARLMYA